MRCVCDGNNIKIDKPDLTTGVVCRQGSRLLHLIQNEPRVNVNIGPQDAQVRFSVNKFSRLGR